MNTQGKRRAGKAASPRSHGGGARDGEHRSPRAALRREQLLSAALELFCEHGYAATSTRRIAEVAGVTEGLVFHYFESKDALLFALMERQTTFAGRILALVTGPQRGSARSLFSAIAAGFAEVSSDEAALIGFLAAEAQVNPAVRERVRAGDAFVLGELEQLLGRRVQAGELRREASLRAAVIGFFGGFSFFFTQNRHRIGAGWRREAARFAEAWADQCWRGLATHAALSKYSTSAVRADAPDDAEGG